jgi:hypothetical protein
VFVNPKDTSDVPDTAQACVRCSHVRPLTEDWWDRDAEKATGFKTTCKGCRKEQRMMKRQHNLRHISKKQGTTVGKALAQMDDGGSNCPHSAELMEKVVSLLGGVNGFAKILVAELFSAPPGSQMRQRALAGLLKLTTDVTASGAAKVPKHLMDDEDIDRELERLGVKLKLHKGEVIDVDAKRVG